MSSFYLPPLQDFFLHLNYTPLYQICQGLEIKTRENNPLINSGQVLGFFEKICSAGRTRTCNPLVTRNPVFSYWRGLSHHPSR